MKTDPQIPNQIETVGMSDEDFWDKLIIGLISTESKGYFYWVSRNHTDENHPSKERMQLFLSNIKNMADEAVKMRIKHKHEIIKKVLES
jgi:ribosomal protein L33